MKTGCLRTYQLLSKTLLAINYTVSLDTTFTSHMQLFPMSRVVANVCGPYKTIAYLVEI